MSLEYISARPVTACCHGSLNKQGTGAQSQGWPWEAVWPVGAGGLQRGTREWSSCP